MNRMWRARLTASAVVTLGFIALAPQSGGASAAPAASPSAAPARTPAGDAQDPCGATKSKWQHMQCQQFNNSAPGDEYFGRLKISYLGIDNTFRDSAISAGAYTTDTRIIAKLMFADEALQRWAAKYPGDPQLPRAYFLGVEVLRKVYTQDMQQMAWRYMQTLVTKYPSSYFAKSLKGNLDKGFTEHWFANALPCPTPLPSASPTPKGFRPKPTPSAPPTPEPTPTPSPAPGQPSVQIITPPCVKPLPTPSPESSPSPSPRSTR